MDYKARAALERVRKALMMRDAGYDAAPDAEDCALLVAALTPPAERESLQGMIAAIYAGLDADDRAFVDCQWREYRRAEFSATPPVEPKTFPNYNMTGLGGECTNALPPAPAILSDLAPLYATPPAETGESDLSYVPIVGAGVDALDRRDPEAMAKISKQLKSWKCWPTTPPAQAEIGEAKKVLAPFYKTVDVMKSAHQRGTLMCIWDDDISAIEGVMLYLEKLRDAEKIRR